MEIVWRAAARDDLSAARRYIAEHNPAAARRVFARIMSAVEQLASHPGIGRPGRVQGTREVVVTRTPYIVAYTLSEGAVAILAVMHGARDWPERF